LDVRRVTCDLRRGADLSWRRPEHPSTRALALATTHGNLLTCQKVIQRCLVDQDPSFQDADALQAWLPPFGGWAQVVRHPSAGRRPHGCENGRPWRAPRPQGRDLSSTDCEKRYRVLPASGHGADYASVLGFGIASRTQRSRFLPYVDADWRSFASFSPDWISRGGWI